MNAKKIVAFVLALMCICASGLAEGIVFPETLTNIEAQAFYGAKNVEISVIPEGTLRIESKAFADSGLKRVVLPDSLVYIADDAFEGCADLIAECSEGSYAHQWLDRTDTPYVLPADLADFAYTIEDGTCTITDYTGTQTNLAIPAQIEGYPVKTIAQYAFDNCYFRCVIIPDGVETIRYDAFSGCSWLSSVHLPDSVTEIGIAAFRSCNLGSFRVPPRVQKIPDELLKDNLSLTEVVIPEGVTEIGEDAFRNCGHLQSVMLPSTLTIIGKGAFDDCDLREMVIPESVDSIGAHAFRSNGNLTKVRMPKEMSYLGDAAFEYCDLASVEIPEGIRDILSYTFYYNSRLEAVIVPSTLETYSVSAFQRCSQPKMFGQPGSIFEQEGSSYTFCVLDRETGYGYSINADGTCTLTGYAGEEPSLTLPGEVQDAKVTVIGKRMFRGCQNVKKVVIPDGVTTIGVDAFFESGVQEIHVPASVESIDTYAFSMISGLVIYGQAGSYVQEYAEENGIRFVEV